MEKLVRQQQCNMKYENLWELWEPVFTEARPLTPSDPSCNKRQEADQ